MSTFDKPSEFESVQMTELRRDVPRETLIARLEAATEGSWLLDSEIAATISGMLNEPWQDPRWHEGGPRYTSSLDAKLPWENIVNVMRRDNDWMAYNYVGEHVEDGGTVGIGKTEPLARRIAALKARS